MSRIRWGVGLLVLAGLATGTFGAGSVNVAMAQRGGHGGFNALSTTVYGTPVPQIQTNAGPVGRPLGTYGGTNLYTNAGPVGRSSVIWPAQGPASLVRPGTNSIIETNNLFGNTPYAGPQNPLSALGITMPDWNGTGNASGRLRATPIPFRIAGPLLIPESLGNPNFPTELFPPNETGASRGPGQASITRIDFRSLSAYGNLPTYRQEIIPEGNPGTSKLATTKLGQPFRWPKFDYRSLSAYGDMERTEANPKSQSRGERIPGER